MVVFVGIVRTRDRELAGRIVGQVVPRDDALVALDGDLEAVLFPGDRAIDHSLLGEVVGAVGLVDPWPVDLRALARLFGFVWQAQR